MRIEYIANDETRFKDEYECLDYEWKIEHPHLKDVEFFDKDGNKLEDMFSLETYGETEKIIVLTQEAANDLMALGSYTGHCCYQNVDSPGTWVFNDDPYLSTFVKIKEENFDKNYKVFCRECKQELINVVDLDKYICECGSRNFIYGETVVLKNNEFACSCGASSDLSEEICHSNNNPIWTTKYRCKKCENIITTQTYYESPNMPINKKL